jgi:HEAT repeat protein
MVMKTWFACWLAGSRRGRGVIGLVLVLAAAAPVSGQESPRQLLEDFVHYALIARPDLAAAKAQVLLESGITNAEMADLIDEDPALVERFDRAISWAQFVPQLEDIAADLALRIEKGRLDLARQSDRIERAIEMLVGTRREQLLARVRLEEAGEYALPALVRTITDGEDQQLKLACESMIREIGRQAVTPLCTALPHLDPVNQRIVCDVLGEIGWPHAAPYLAERSQDESADKIVREAAARAFRRVGGVNGDLSTLYSNLGRQYFNQVNSLVAFPFEPTNNVWSYDAFGGLEAQPVATAIYSEVMAMQLAAKALRLDPANRRALGLFVAANLKRENDLPSGESDPIYGESDYTPAFYATVFGTEVCLDVLGVAIDSLDTPLVRDAMVALAGTTGGGNLFPGGAGRQPLLEALQYPDRRVRYEAALILGQALPSQAFSGDYAVVGLLASAVRTGNRVFALVIAPDEEDRRVRGNQLEDLGFDIAGSGPGVVAVGAAIAEAIGIDLVLIKKSSADDARQTVADLRARTKTSATPVVVLADRVEFPDLKQNFATDAWVQVVPSNVIGEAFGASIDTLMERASGGRLTEAESEAYAIDALSALRDIAISNSPVYDIGDAAPALIDAMETRSGGTLLLVADILAVIDSDDAQRTLFSAALAATGDEQIELLDRVAVSVKRYGDRTEPHHVDALLDLVKQASGELAEAAARIHGALNLPTDAALELIPG